MWPSVSEHNLVVTIQLEKPSCFELTLQINAEDSAEMWVDAGGQGRICNCKNTGHSYPVKGSCFHQSRDIQTKKQFQLLKRMRSLRMYRDEKVLRVYDAINVETKIKSSQS